ncbi:MAG: hypothetical protein E6094_05580 [Clostridium perfringens]|nr:hypothetical protein [Clostridium perfringens]
MNSNDIKTFVTGIVEFNVLVVRKIIEEGKRNVVCIDDLIMLHGKMIELVALLINVNADEKQIDEIIDLVEEIQKLIYEQLNSK